MPANVVPFACPACGEDRLVDREGAVWACRVCGKHGRRGVRPDAPTGSPAPSAGLAPAVTAGPSVDRTTGVSVRLIQDWDSRPALLTGPSADSSALLEALVAVVLQRHLTPGPWTVSACAPLAQWPPSLQRELTATLGALPESVVLVLERGPR